MDFWGSSYFAEYSTLSNASGDWGIFFRILFSDEAAEQRLREAVRRVEAKISEKFDFPGLGVLAYFDFRSQSEQAFLKDKDWM